MMHANYFGAILAQAATQPATAPQGSPGSQGLFGNPIIFMVLMVVIFYFILIRPQQQRSKQQAKMLAALKAGDDVITASGIVATVVNVKDKTVTLRSGDAKFEVTKASVTEIVAKESSTPAS